MRELFEPYYPEQVVLELLKNAPAEYIYEFLSKQRGADNG